MKKETRLTLAIALSLTFMTAEIIGGIFANSLAILTDAAHLLTDVAGFGIALLATVMSRAPASENYTYGLARAEVMGALASILTLWVMTGCLIYEAYNRTVLWMRDEAENVDGRLMFIIACLGVVVNICLSCVFYEEHGGAFHSHDHDHGDHGHSHGHDHGHARKADIESHEHHHEHASSYQQDHHNHSHDHGHSHDHHDDHHDHHSDHDDHENTSLMRSYGSISHELPAGPAVPSDVNIQAAYLHVITDLIQSVGVALAGALIWWKPEWQILDPICTFLFSILVLWYIALFYTCFGDG